MLHHIVHYGIHLILPLIVGLIWFKPHWKSVYFIMISTMLIDLDHLLAIPIYDAARCSINFHPLHSYVAIAIYGFLIIPKKTRILGLGLVIHILADQMDCLFM